MKFTKTQFKTLMRECLTELITEGVFDKKLEQIVENRSLSSSNGKQIPLTEQTSVPLEGQQNTNPRILEAVKIATMGQQGGKKSIFQEILLDTAMTTLQKQLSGETGSGGGPGAAGLMENMPVSAGEKARDDRELAVLAGGNPERWALAAFGGKKKKP